MIKRYILPLALAASLAANAIYAFRLGQRPAPTQEPQQAAEAVVKTPSLADAITLLPHPEHAFGGRALDAGRYWVWAEVPANDSGVQQEQSWSVDIVAGRAELLSERRFGPGGGSAVWAEWYSTDDYWAIEWEGGWEGYYEKVVEYVNRSTGKLDKTLTINSGEWAMLEVPGRKVEIRLVPERVCAGTDQAHPEADGSATGLLIDGKITPFPKPISVDCGWSDFDGSAHHQTFQSFTASQDGYYLELYGTSVKLDAALNPVWN